MSSNSKTPSSSLTPAQASVAAANQPVNLQIRPRLRRRHDLVLDTPIGTRLTMGFLIAALIAALVTGAIGLQRAQSLKGQSDFYQNLLQANTKLNTAASFLQLMNTEVHSSITLLNSQHPSQETLDTQEKAIQGLTTRYDQTLTDYAAHNILNKHADQVALLKEADHQGQVTQQETLTASTLRTWNLYHTAQDQILAYINQGNINDAATLEQVQGELTNADALSALRALIRFNGNLGNSIQDVEGIEAQSQLIWTIVGSVIAFIGILLIGWFISGTIVRRLRSLRQVTLSVEHGELTNRVDVIGRDEIADVSASVNAMLDAIVGLLEETRSQRDALTNAAEHLFSDMRVVSAGDLRINAPVTNDPIGMLANAFNFTVGRFRRAVQRTKTTTERIDVLARQGLERAESYQQALHTSSQSTRTGTLADFSSSYAPMADNLTLRNESQAALAAHLQRAREHLQQLSGESLLRHTRAVSALADQMSTTINRIMKAQTQRDRTTGDMVQMQTQELRALETVLTRMVSELQNVQMQSLKGYKELDQDLNQIGTALRTVRSRSVSDAPSLDAASQEGAAEIIRLSNAFANDMMSMARQLMKLIQELREGALSFQLDAMENAATVSLSNLPATPSTPLPPGYRFSEDLQSQKTLPFRPEPRNLLTGAEDQRY